MSRKISTTRAKEMADLYATGMSARAIASMFQTGKSTVVSNLRFIGAPVREKWCGAGPIWRAEVAGRYTVALADVLYRDCQVALPRKKRLALEFQGWCPRRQQLFTEAS